MRLLIWLLVYNVVSSYQVEEADLNRLMKLVESFNGEHEFKMLTLRGNDGKDNIFEDEDRYCVDRVAEECPDWLIWLGGSCDGQNGAFKQIMLSECKATCGACPKSTTINCNDKKKDCKELANQGYCRSMSNATINFDYMTKNCQKSCGICGNLPDYLLDQQSCTKISTIPEHVAKKYDLDGSFYGKHQINTDKGEVTAYTGKYTEAYGFPITSSSGVDDRALMRMCYIVRWVYASYKQIRKAAHKNFARFVIIGRNERTTQIPAYSDMDKYWDQRARGLGGRVASSSEENLLTFDEKNSWSEIDVALHETSHNFHLSGMTKGMPKLFAEIKKGYKSAKAAGKYFWKEEGICRDFSGNEYKCQIPLYALNNKKEYFAQGVLSYVGDIDVPPFTAKELKQYDPTLYSIVKRALICNGPETFIKQRNDIDQVLTRQSRIRINFPDCKLEPESNIPKESSITLKTKEAGLVYTWNRETCILPWQFKGEKYDGCKKEKHYSWCPTQIEDGKFSHSSVNFHLATWGYCQNNREITLKPCAKTASGRACIFPFLYLRLKHATCQGTGWCATKVDGGKNMLEWSTCNKECYSSLGEATSDKTLQDLSEG